MKLLLLATLIAGTITGATDVDMEIYRTECGQEVLQQATSTDGFYYFTINTKGVHTVYATKDGYTFEPTNREYIVVEDGESVTDADFTAINTRVFIDNGDGTITDNNTKLVWLKNDCFGEVSLATAKTLVADLGDGTCGLSDNSSACDWYLPSWAQLQRLGTNPPIAWGDVMPYPAIPWTVSFANLGEYWTTNGVRGIPTDARYVDMEHGFMWSGAKTDLHYILPVRRLK